MLIFILSIFESLQSVEAYKDFELLLNSNSQNLGQRRIYIESETKYFLGTSKNISSNTETDYLLFYSISLISNSSIFDPMFIQNINPPPFRKYYGIFSGDYEIYIYGGVSESKVFNDFWSYDIKTGVWTDISRFFTKFNLQPLYDYGYISFRAGYGDNKITYNYIMISGGVNDRGKFVDEVWVLIYDEKIDEKIIRDPYFTSIAGCSNGPLAGHKIVRSNYHFYIFSGYRREDEDDSIVYSFPDVCYLDFFSNSETFVPNQNFSIFKLTLNSVMLFNDYAFNGAIIYRLFGIEYVDGKALYNTKSIH